MLRIEPPVLVAAALLALAACQPHHSSASSAESHAPGTTTASVAADCSKYPQGAPGVIRTFCDGRAVVKLTIGGVPHTLSGGACSAGPGGFALNLGVVAGPDLAGPKPDYVGLTAPAASGAFNNATLDLVVDGKSYEVTENAGVLQPGGGNFTGKAITGEAVSGAFTC